MVGLGQVGGFGGRLQGVVPASQVDIRPPQRGQARAAGALLAGRLEALHGVLQHGDRQRGFIQEPRRGTGSPQSGLVQGRTADLVQVPDELASAAERVGAGPDPEPVRFVARRWRSLSFQEFKDAADGPAAMGRA